MGQIECLMFDWCRFKEGFYRVREQSAPLNQRLLALLGRIYAGLLSTMLPEWQVFIRLPDGRGRYFVVTRRRQLACVASLVAILGWAGIANLLLLRQPAEISAREQQLDQEIAKLKEAQERLVAAGGLVSDLTREVSEVHTNLIVLADTNAQLTKDREQNGKPMPLAKLRAGFDSLMDGGAKDEPAAVGGVRENLRKLRASLDQLKLTYVQALTQTAALADQRASDVENSLTRLGVNVENLIHRKSESRGRGGPFVPLVTRTPADEEVNKDMADLLVRLDHWDEVKAVTAALPLAEPLHEEWEVNSPFGARFDPLNENAGVHEGMDMGAPYGTPIYATGEGHVKLAGPYDRYGLTVDVDHGNGFVTRYAHLSQIKVHAGQKVTRETVVGLLGNTGRTTGAHLHYEVRIDDVPRNPITYIAAGRDASKAR